MILADEVLQCRVGSRHFVGATVEDVLRCALRNGVLCYRVDVLRDDSLAQSATFDEAVYVGANRIVGEKVLFCFDLNDVIAER